MTISGSPEATSTALPLAWALCTPGRRSPIARQRPAVTLIDVLLVLAVIGSAVLRPLLGGGFAFVDTILIVINLVALKAHAQHANVGTVMLRRLAPFLWVLLAATVLTLFGAGPQSWAIETGARVLLAPLTFTSFLVLMLRWPPSVERARGAFIAIAVLVSLNILLVTGSALRQAGSTFPHPNYAAHFLVTVLVLIWADRRTSRLAVWIVTAVLIGALLRTGSFGGAMQLAGFLVYALWRVGGHRPRRDRLPIRLLSLTILLAIGVGTFIYAGSADYDVGSGLSSERFVRSQEGRGEILGDALAAYSDHPEGLAPGGFKYRKDLGRNDGREVHNDAVAFLVEHGPIGLAAALGIVAVIWRATTPGGTTRALLVSFAVASLFRQTFTYRHLWLALAVGLALDIRRPRHRQRPDDRTICAEHWTSPRTKAHQRTSAATWNRLRA